eukprot:m.257887 g.257887  ORF g.257887 m.257887 type:complete len:166 (+) comp21133_c0_seq1:150-647(+)
MKDLCQAILAMERTAVKHREAVHHTKLFTVDEVNAHLRAATKAGSLDAFVKSITSIQSLSQRSREQLEAAFCNAYKESERVTLYEGLEVTEWSDKGYPSCFETDESVCRHVTEHCHDANALKTAIDLRMAIFVLLIGANHGNAQWMPDVSHANVIGMYLGQYLTL